MHHACKPKGAAMAPRAFPDDFLTMIKYGRRSGMLNTIDIPLPFRVINLSAYESRIPKRTKTETFGSQNSNNVDGRFQKELESFQDTRIVIYDNRQSMQRGCDVGL